MALAVQASGGFIQVIEPTKSTKNINHFQMRSESFQIKMQAQEQPLLRTIVLFYFISAENLLNV